MMHWIIAFISIFALIIWGGLLEDGAESQAKEFCGAVLIGDSFLETVEKAKTAGEDRLRLIGKESITVGFTGIPPFSRHLCEITRSGDEIGEKRYFYLD